MTGRTEEIKTLIEAYLDQADADSLKTACQRLRQSRIDMNALLDWIQHYRADRNLKSLALRQVRHALGLPLIPGPVCKTPNS